MRPKFVKVVTAGELQELQQQTLLLSPKDGKANSPKSIKKSIRIATPKVWLWGRLKSEENETAEQLSALQQQFNILPLSQFGKPNDKAQLPIISCKN